jgi:hypothetical protein
MDDHVALLFVVGEHTFAAAVEHHSTRILDVLNDAQSALLRVKNVVVFPGLCGTPLAEFAEATLQKSSLDFVVLTDNHHEAPVRRKFSLVDKQGHATFALLAKYEIRGTAMLERSIDPELLLSARASNFFPIVNPTITSPDKGSPPLSAHVAFVNKQKVSLIEIDKRTVVPA